MIIIVLEEKNLEFLVFEGFWVILRCFFVVRWSFVGPPDLARRFLAVCDQRSRCSGQQDERRRRLRRPGALALYANARYRNVHTFAALFANSLFAGAFRATRSRKNYSL